MQTNNSKNQSAQLPSRVVADHRQLDLAISNFFKCYALEETEDRIYRMLEEWIYDNGSKQSVSDADDAGAFIKCLKGLMDVVLNPNLKAPCSLAYKIEEHINGFGETGTQEMLDSFLQSWNFSTEDDPKLIDVCNNVGHSRDLVKFTRVLAKEGGFSC